MQLHEITSHKPKNQGVQRVGRGIGSHRGKTSGRGTKGQKARTGGNVPAHFEGGQKPLMQILPKTKGFHRPNRPNTLVINLSDLPRVAENNILDLEILRKQGYMNGFDLVKILGDGEVTTAYALTVHGISASARAKVEKAGGKIILVK